MAGETGIASITCSGARGPAEMFVSLYRFLTTSGSTVAGITLIANNSGSATSSNGGFNHWDMSGSQAVENNAWACFQFTSASIPFYMLLQFATSSAGDSPFGIAARGGNGAPGYLLNTVGALPNAKGGVGIQFAMRSDGLSPWTGTSGALGNDMKGNPVWTTGSNVSDPQNAFVWPRTNSISGSGAPTLTSGSRERCLAIASTNYMDGTSGPGQRIHFSCNFENVAIARDSLGSVGTYNYLWFGKYQINSGTWPIGESSLTVPVPYAMIWRDTETGIDPSIAIGTANQYGSLSGETVLEGGVAHPILSGQVCAVSVGTLDNIPFQAQYHPNKFYTSSPTYDEFPLQLYMNEINISGSSVLANSTGLLGQTDYLRFVYGLLVGDQASGSSGFSTGSAVGQLRIVLGSNPTVANNSKYSFPWSSNVRDNYLSGGLAVGNRTGSYF